MPLQHSSTRQITDLGGIWDFATDPCLAGGNANWAQDGIPAQRRRLVAVPASFNDQFADASVRDHVGFVWYAREFCVPPDWRGKAIALRFDSVTHHATVWLNGEEVVTHHGGYLPFETPIDALLRFDAPNRLTVRVDNRLSWDTIPPGELILDNAVDGAPYPIQDYHFDFFNYAGIDRPVKLVACHRTHIEHLSITPVFREDVWEIDYKVETVGGDCTVAVSLIDPDGHTVAHADAASGRLRVSDPILWEPGAARLYRVRAALHDAQGNLLDDVNKRTGLRRIEVKPDAFLINGQPFYFRGFGKHEDFHVHGKGLNLPLLIRDFELLKWIGVNSVRTTHYPYSEEFLDLADELGIVVIGECPAVGQNKFRGADPVFTETRINGNALRQHKQTLSELIARDAHHPCVVMWSLGNEPASADPEAEGYFAAVAAHARACDPHRPLTIVETTWWNATRVAQFCDVIAINRYFGWYLKTGHLPLIQEELRKDLHAWHKAFNKPVLIAEYGADTIAGLHHQPPIMFSEEFQEEFLRLYHEVFDECPWVIGEHVWNFADFATKQGTTRVGGNRKGIFTRDRHPKAAARLLRQRWAAAKSKKID